MGDDLVKQFIAELQDLVQCRCHEAFKGRGLHDPDCHCDTAEAVKVVADRIEELEAKLAKAVEALEKMNVGEGWAAQIARSTLAELTGGKDE